MPAFLWDTLTNKQIENIKSIISSYDKYKGFDWGKDHQEAAEWNSPRRFLDLSNKKKDALVNWCIENFTHIKSFNNNHTSYNFKHWAEDTLPEMDGYVSNGEMKGAMIVAGFYPKDPENINCHYKVSEKSPIIKKRFHSRRHTQWHTY